MNSIDEIASHLQRIAQLLRDFEEHSWAQSFEALKHELATDPSHTAWKITRLYGGAGSFSDLVLHQNRVAPRLENDELAQLRSALYGLCRQQNSSKNDQF
ncbi:DUF6966 domain-containing protein [Pseudomonas sp. NPDC090202]|uniref:DUF6966 domain-containing protein n=1 Tax=unclassified Pseudomonas TaxID=196821 RepID=UPI0038306A0E